MILFHILIAAPQGLGFSQHGHWIPRGSVQMLKSIGCRSGKIQSYNLHRVSTALLFWSIIRPAHTKGQRKKLYLSKEDWRGVWDYFSPTTIYLPLGKMEEGEEVSIKKQSTPPRPYNVESMFLDSRLKLQM